MHTADLYKITKQEEEIYQKIRDRKLANDAIGAVNINMNIVSSDHKFIPTPMEIQELIRDFKERCDATIAVDETWDDVASAYIANLKGDIGDLAYRFEDLITTHCDYAENVHFYARQLDDGSYTLWFSLYCDREEGSHRCIEGLIDEDDFSDLTLEMIETTIRTKPVKTITCCICGDTNINDTLSFVVSNDVGGIICNECLAILESEE